YKVVERRDVLVRLSVSDDDLRKLTNARPVDGLFGQKRRLGMGLFEILENGPALGDIETLGGEDRHGAKRISGQVFARTLLAFQEVYGHGFVGDALQSQRPAHAPRRGRAPIVIKNRTALGHGGSRLGTKLDSVCQTAELGDLALDGVAGAQPAVLVD